MVVWFRCPHLLKAQHERAAFQSNERIRCTALRVAHWGIRSVLGSLALVIARVKNVVQIHDVSPEPASRKGAN